MCDGKGLVGVEVRSLSHFGPVSTDEEMQTAGQPGGAMTLSELLTLICSKDGERVGGRNSCKRKMNSSTVFFFYIKANEGLFNYCFDLY